MIVWDKINFNYSTLNSQPEEAGHKFESILDLRMTFSDLE